MGSKDYRDALGGFALVVIGLGAVATVLATLRLGYGHADGAWHVSGRAGCAAGRVRRADHGARDAQGRRDAALRVPPVRYGRHLDAGLRAAGRELRAGPCDRGGHLISSRADDKLSLRGALVLGLCLAVICSVLFKYAVGLPIAFLRWPW